jgi:hypothetical protein
MDPLAKQLAELQNRYPDARLEQADGQRMLVVPGVRTANGWSVAETTVRVIVPVGFPQVHPDCFYTEPQLRLATGAEPANTAFQVVFGGQYRWFSWHVVSWSAQSGSLDQYVRFCERRLQDPR